MREVGATQDGGPGSGRVVASRGRGSRETGTLKPVSAGNSKDVWLHALTAIDT